MSSNLQNSWFMIGAAVVGIVSAAGVILAEHFRQEKRRHAMAKDLARLDQQVLGLKGQLEVLQRRHQNLQENRHKTRKHTVKSTTTTASSVASDDFNSVVDMDSSDMEFYDVSDEENSKASTITPMDTVLREVDEKLDEHGLAELNSAFVLLDNLCSDYPESPDLLWRVGKAHYKMCQELEDKTEKLEHIGQGLEACEQAIRLRPECGDSHKWYALLRGSRTDFVSQRERIKDSMIFKEHLDLALRIKPDDPTLHHSLGRYTMEIASLKWYEKKAVAALYGELPECTHADAIKMLLEAERLSEKSWKENKLALAKCYAAVGDYKETVKWLEDAERIEPINLMDSVDSEIKQLLSKYSGYR